MKSTQEITKTLTKTFFALKIITASGIAILTAFLIFFIVAVTQDLNFSEPELVFNCLIVFLVFVVAYVIAAIAMLIITKGLVKRLDLADKAEHERALEVAMGKLKSEGEGEATKSADKSE